MNIIKSNKFLIGLIIVASVIPLFVESKFHLNTLILILMFATIASAWNILGGYAGQLSLGHTIFFGLGAYTSTLLYLNYGLSPWIGLFIAAAISILVGIFIGWPTFRLRGTYFSLATIAFAEVVRHIALYWRELTNGSMGVNIRFEPGVANLIFREYSSYYYFALVLFLFALAIVYYVDRTRIGYYLKAIRENEDSAATLGIDVTKYKMIAMIMSAGLTGIAGVLYAQFMLFFEPDSVFNLNFSIEIALITIVGGMGTIFGPLLGAVIIIPLNEIMRSSFPELSGMNYFIYGIALILIVSFMPNGLLPLLKKIPAKFISKKKLDVKGGTDIDSSSK